MKTIANRLIVFAASTIAFVASGTSAFGQTRMTAEIPFAFHTATGTLPAGTYEIRDSEVGGNPHVVYLQNMATLKGAVAGSPMYNAWGKTIGGSVVEFVCTGRDCSLKAIRTIASSLEFAAPRMSKDGKSKAGEKMAVVRIPMKPLNAD